MSSLSHSAHERICLLWEHAEREIRELERFATAVEGMLAVHEANGETPPDSGPPKLTDRMRGAILASSCASAEYYLERLCRLVGMNRPEARDWREGRGSTVQKIRRFLGTGGAGRRPSALTWQIVARVFDLRSFLLHNRGMMLEPRRPGSAREKRTRRFVERNPHLGLHDGWVVLGPGFIHFTLEIFYQLLLDAFSQAAGTDLGR